MSRDEVTIGNTLVAEESVYEEEKLSVLPKGIGSIGGCINSDNRILFKR